MDKETRAVVTETKALIKEVESGDTDHAAWVAIQDRVKELYDNRTQAEVGEMIGKSDTWVSQILRWDSRARGSKIPWASGSNKRNDVAKKVLGDPKMIEKVISELPPEQVKVISKVADDVRAQQHEGTAKRAPLGMPEARTYGFTMEMNKPSMRLKHAISDYVEAWDLHAPDATAEEKQTERDLIAPDLLNLRMTVEGVEV